MGFPLKGRVQVGTEKNKNRGQVSTFNKRDDGMIKKNRGQVSTFNKRDDGMMA